MYGTVLVPEAVYREVVKVGAGRAGSNELAAASWCQMVVPPAQAVAALQALLPQLGAGEVSAIVFALTHQADLVVMDDWAARQAAHQRGLKIKGTMGILLEAKAQGHVPLVGTLIQDLLRTGAWLDPALTIETLKIAGEHP